MFFRLAMKLNVRKLLVASLSQNRRIQQVLEVGDRRALFAEVFVKEKEVSNFGSFCGFLSKQQMRTGLPAPKLLRVPAWIPTGSYGTLR